MARGIVGGRSSTHSCNKVLPLLSFSHLSEVRDQQEKLLTVTFLMHLCCIYWSEPPKQTNKRSLVPLSLSLSLELRISRSLSHPVAFFLSHTHAHTYNIHAYTEQTAASTPLHLCFITPSTENYTWCQQAHVYQRSEQHAPLTCDCGFRSGSAVLNRSCDAQAWDIYKLNAAYHELLWVLVACVMVVIVTAGLAHTVPFWSSWLKTIVLPLLRSFIIHKH